MLYSPFDFYSLWLLVNAFCSEGLMYICVSWEWYRKAIFWAKWFDPKNTTWSRHSQECNRFIAISKDEFLSNVLMKIVVMKNWSFAHFQLKLEMMMWKAANFKLHFWPYQLANTWKIILLLLRKLAVTKT